MELRTERRSFVMRAALLTAMAVGLTVLPARGQDGCEACVWEWNGSGYSADCEAATSGGYDGCIPADETHCWAGDSCPIVE